MNKTMVARLCVSFVLYSIVNRFQQVISYGTPVKFTSYFYTVQKYDCIHGNIEQTQTRAQQHWVF